MSESTLSEAILQAYRETRYYVEDTSTVILQIDKPSDGIEIINKRYGVSSSAFITAHNPFSQMLSTMDNQKRQHALLEELARQKFRIINGIGQHPSNEWPGEPSVLVLGITLQEAESLGRQFGQNAIVFISDSNTPRLVLLQ